MHIRVNELISLEICTVASKQMMQRGRLESTLNMLTIYQKKILWEEETHDLPLAWTLDNYKYTA